MDKHASTSTAYEPVYELEAAYEPEDDDAHGGTSGRARRRVELCHS